MSYPRHPGSKRQPAFLRADNSCDQGTPLRRNNGRVSKATPLSRSLAALNQPLGRVPKCP
jgi:hypothetical protein